MEAIAIYSFEANSESELSFNAQDKIIVSFCVVHILK
jgi:hypothetical protein